MRNRPSWQVTFLLATFLAFFSQAHLCLEDKGWRTKILWTVSCSLETFSIWNLVKLLRDVSDCSGNEVLERRRRTWYTNYAECTYALSLVISKVWYIFHGQGGNVQSPLLLLTVKCLLCSMPCVIFSLYLNSPTTMDKQIAEITNDIQFRACSL